MSTIPPDLPKDAGARLSGFARKILDLEAEARDWVAGSADHGGSLQFGRFSPS